MIVLDDAALEARILEIGRRTGLSPQDVVARAIGVSDASDLDRRETLIRERTAAVCALRAKLPPLSDAEKAAIDAAARDLYDETGVPK